MEQRIGLSYQKVEYNRRKMDHQRPKVVPKRVVLVGPQVSLGKTVRNAAAHERFAHKTIGLDWVALEDVQALLGHHDNGWRPNQSTTGPTPQQPVEATKAY